ncbi:MAG: hypothetical protein B6U76_06475 [Desulfurococcales archaeon ex4484_217_2]|nr:MAG: hypothetical protein B6U76_06475 [Desulfurococcales archaeon ex4484_217_2]
MVSELLAIESLATIASAIVAKKSSKAAGIITLTSSVSILAYLMIIGPKVLYDVVSLGAILPGNIVIGLTQVGWYFSFIVALVMLMASMFSLEYVKKPNATYWLLFNLTFLGAIGVTLSIDLVSFFLFWELMTWSSYLMVALGDTRAGLKYFLFSILGSISLLLAFALMWRLSGSTIIPKAFPIVATSSTAIRIQLIMLLTVGFGVKAAMFPIHVWAPDAYPATPQPFAALFSGGLAKLGAYGLALLTMFVSASKFMMFEDVVWGYVLAWLGAVTIIVGAVLAALQENVLKLIAYSSVSQMGYVVVGLALMTSLGMASALYQALNHALFGSLMFLIAGAVYLATGTLNFKDLGGIADKMPLTYTAALIAVLSSAGIPLTTGFNSKWMLFEALIIKNYYLIASAVFVGSVLGFLYNIKFIYGIFLGQRPKSLENVNEVGLLALIPMLTLAFLNLAFGILPGIPLQYVNTALASLGIPSIEASLTGIYTNIGYWNVLYVSVGFISAFGLAMVLFIAGGKLRRVSVLETYMSGFIPPENYVLRINYDFYQPLKFVFGRYLRLSVDRAYAWTASFFVKVADIIRKPIYLGDAQAYVWYIIATIILLFLIFIGGGV